MKIHVLVADEAERAGLHRDLAVRLPMSFGLSSRLEEHDVVWIHGTRAGVPGGTSDLGDDQIQRLRGFLLDGGRILLTGPAAVHVTGLCDEPEAPDVIQLPQGAGIPAGSLPLDVGVCAVPGGQTLRRFPGGLHLRRLTADVSISEAVYGGGRRPRRGVVLGLERRGDGLDPDRAIWFAHTLGKGRVMSFGAHLVFAEALPYREHRARLIGDLVDLLLNARATAAARSWPMPTPSVCFRAGGSPSVPVPELAPKSRVQGQWRELDVVGPWLMANASGIVAAVDRAGGLRALCQLPLRLLEDVDVVCDEVLSCQAHAEQVERRLRIGGMPVLQRITLGPSALQMDFQNEGDQGVTVELAGKAVFLPPAPAPSFTCGRLQVASEGDGRRLEVTDHVLSGRLCLETGQEPLTAAVFEASLEASSPGGPRAQVGFHRTFGLAAGGSCSWVFTCGGHHQEGEKAVPLPDLFATMVDLRAHETVPLGATAELVDQPGLLVQERLAAARALLVEGRFAEVQVLLRRLASFQDPMGRIPTGITAAALPVFGDGQTTAGFVELVAEWFESFASDPEAAAGGLKMLMPAVRRALLAMEPDALHATAFEAGARCAEAASDTALATICRQRIVASVRAGQDNGATIPGETGEIGVSEAGA